MDEAIARVLSHGGFILGPEVKALEAELAARGGVKHCVSCANGTDALLLILRAWNIGPGDAVFVPSFTFAATGVMLIVVGNILGKLRANYVIGIRTRWTLADPTVWDKTHRFTGRLMFAGGR